MNMPSNKSPGNDKVTLNVLKDCLHIVSESLTDLINLSFTSNIFPIAWKTAEVIPLEKEGDCEIASNNRPISLLVANSKLYERVVHDQLTSYLERYGRLTRHQRGNKHKHSTESVHLMVTDHIFNAIDKRKITVLVLFDLSKAFDSVDHDLLLYKLRLCLRVTFPAGWKLFGLIMKNRIYFPSRKEYHKGVYLAPCCLIFL